MNLITLGLELNTYRLLIKPKDSTKLLIIYKKDNKEAGYIIINPIDNNSFDIKFNISESYSKIGVGTEALREVVRYLFMEYKADSIKIVNAINNKKAERVIIKNRFILDKADSSNNYYSLDRAEYYKKKEKVQLFDKDGNSLDDIFFRGEKFIDGKYVGVVDIIIYNTKYDKFLMTRRDLNKETYPGFWEISGGAIDYGEDINSAALREAKEETGIALNKVEYKYSTLLEPMLYFTYMGYIDCELDTVVLQEKETIDYKWLEKDEFKQMYEGFNVPDKQKLRLSSLIKKL
ncbi:MAG: GNAT family N-acetyltransferase [Acholeplasmatales bacterium]|nr:GNAT family N-acetyltransferase [Acholeplasmatales bacterium]